MMVNRNDINNIIKKFLPVSSNVIGAPRSSATMKEYAKQKPSFCKLQQIPSDFANEENKNAPAFFNITTVPQKNKFFTAHLCNARVWGSNGAVIAAHDFFIEDVSREFNKGLNIKHSVFYKIKQCKAKKISGITAIIGTAGASIYYHWMIDILPRLGLINAVKPLSQIDHFLTGFDGLEFQTETLAKLKISLDKIIPSNKNHAFHINADVLITPSFAGELDQPNELQVNFLRTLYKENISTVKSFRRLYISRKKTNSRAIVNESELSSLLIRKDFEIIYCEDLKVSEQVLLFSQASIIICSHGSALTNLVFCGPRTIVVDIFNPSQINACFWFISQINQLQYYYLLGEAKPIDNNFKNDQTIVDLIEFNKILQKIGLNES